MAVDVVAVSRLLLPFNQLCIWERYPVGVDGWVGGGGSGGGGGRGGGGVVAIEYLQPGIEAFWHAPHIFLAVMAFLVSGLWPGGQLRRQGGLCTPAPFCLLCCEGTGQTSRQLPLGSIPDASMSGEAPFPKLRKLVGLTATAMQLADICRLSGSSAVAPLCCRPVTSGGTSQPRYLPSTACRSGACAL